MSEKEQLATIILDILKELEKQVEEKSSIKMETFEAGIAMLIAVVMPCGLYSLIDIDTYEDITKKITDIVEKAKSKSDNKFTFLKRRKEQ